MKSQTATEHNDDGTFSVELRGRATDGWSEAREDLGLNKAGPSAVEGVEVEDEDPRYYDDDEEFVAGYDSVTLRFEDADAIEEARDRLHEKATERFEYGIADSAKKVQDFASVLPVVSEVR